MDTHKLYPRFASERLKEALADTLAVLIHGPRQSGKTTLARGLGETLGYSYFTFDNLKSSLIATETAHKVDS